MSDTNVELEDAIEAVPHVRWDEEHHRLKFTSPRYVQPGNSGYFVMQEFNSSSSFGADSLPETLKEELVEMDKLNDVARKVELQDKLHKTIEKCAHGSGNDPKHFVHRDHIEMNKSGAIAVNGRMGAPPTNEHVAKHQREAKVKIQQPRK